MKLLSKYITVIKKNINNHHGVTAIIVALILVVLLGFAALAIDIGYLMASKNEAQNVADAAALAGAGELGDQLWNSGIVNETDIRAVAKEIALKNQIAVNGHVLQDSDIEICRWDGEICNPTGVGEKPTAVRVKIRSDSIGTWFARVLNIDSFGVSTYATAALTGVSQPPEDLIPVGISSYWYEHVWPDGEFCDQDIKFYPTNTINGCAGWHVFTESQATPSNLWDIMEEINNGTYEYPDAGIGDEYKFTGATAQSALCQDTKYSFEDLYNDNKNAEGEWEVTAVVYGDESCKNPSGELPIVGFTTVIITGVTCTPEKTINGKVACDKFADSRGGGGDYGTFGRIPGLVE